MINFKTFHAIESLQQEAIRMSYAKNYTRDWGKNAGGRYFYDSWFGKDDFGKPLYRYYIDIANGNSLMNNPPSGWTRIKDELHKHGFKITSYEAGRCTKIVDDRHEFKIGKILNRLSPDVINLYNRLTDEESKELTQDENELLLVISRHPYDIIGMSTDREKWDSCTAVPNASTGKHRLPKDHHMNVAEYSVIEYIKSNSLIAYIIKAGDYNIEHPIGRVIIYPYSLGSGEYIINKDERYMRISDKHYGRFSDNIRSLIQHWLDERQGKFDPKKIYYSHETHYMDDNPTRIGEFSPEEFLKKYIDGHYTRNSDGSYDVKGNIVMNDSYFTEIPVRFGKVTGNVSCNEAKLKTLKGFPHTVTGDFNCMENRLVNLEGGPTSVGETYSCAHNYELTSLRGAPTFVGETFYATLCDKLESLAYGPTHAEDYKYDMCRGLKSLEGAPMVVEGDFDISYCPGLKTYKGGPKIVKGVLNLSGNEKLRDFPEYLEQASIIDTKNVGYTEREIEFLRDQHPYWKIYT